jgi:hypothetical protein
VVGVKILLVVALLLLGGFHPVRAAAVLTVEREIAQSPVEIGVGFTARGVERWRFIGTADGLDMPEWMPRSIRGGVFTHNHPGEGHCVSPSVDDAQFGAWYHLAQVRAVGYEAGTVYVAILYSPRWIDAAQYNAAFDREAWRDWCNRIAATWADLGISFERVSG